MSLRIKLAMVSVAISLLTACQSNPHTVPSPPQATPSASVPSPLPTSDISTGGVQSPAPTASPFPTPSPVPTPGGIPSATARPSATPVIVPSPVFYLPAPTCAGCGYKVTSVRQAAWSPDGMQLAYVLNENESHCTVSSPRPSDDLSSGNWPTRCVSAVDDKQAFVKPNPSSAAVALTEKNRIVELRGWSPQGDRILLELFSLDANGNNQVYTVKPDGTQLSRVYPTQTRQQLPSWSADGTQVAFITPELNRNVSWIEAINTDGSNWRQLTSMLDFPRQFLWHNGRVAFAEPWVAQAPGSPYGSRLWTVSPTGDTALVPLTGLEDKTLFDFRWSPDGKWLAYISLDYMGNQAHLMLASGDSSVPRELKMRSRTDSGSLFQGLTWSPDSRFLAYSQSEVTAAGVSISDLYLFEPQTQNTTQLTHAAQTGLPILYRNPSWSPDSQRLAFISNHEVKFREVYSAPDSLYSMQRDGTAIQLEVRGTHLDIKP